MKTVIIDNSLCTLPIDEHASPEMISRYIRALAEAGVKYVELDFRTIMKMHELPECVGYIFRLGDPMFAELTQAFDFNYVLVTINDLKDPLHIGKTPVIMEFPALHTLSRQLIRLAQDQVSGQIAMARLRGNFGYMTPESAREFVWRAKSSVTVPVDICPMNGKKTALDTALKVSNANVDSMTLCMGRSKNYASLEEFMFSLMTVFESQPKELDLSGLCKAAAYHKLVFGRFSGDCISETMKLLDYDIAHLTNTDTGNRVKMHISLKDKMLLRQNYISALRRFAEEEDIPEDIAQDIFDAIDHFDMSLFDQYLVQDEKNKILN